MNLIIIIFGCVRMYFVARQKGLNGGSWALKTLASMFIAAIGGMILSMAILVARNPDLLRNAPIGDFGKSMEYWEKVDLFLPQLFSIICAGGGYLLIHYLLSKVKPVKNPADNQPM